MADMFRNGKKAFAAYAAITFVVLLIITQLLVYQRYRAVRADDRADLQYELGEVRWRLAAILQHNISSANTIAMLYQYDTTLNWFDSTANKLLTLNEGMDRILFYEHDILTHVYPLKGNEQMVGADIRRIPQIRAESELVDKDGQLPFAGPFDMPGRKDKSITGRVRIYDHGKLVARAGAVSSFTSIFKLMPEFRNKGDKFVFRIAKKSPLTGKTEYFFDGYTPKEGWADSVYMPQGDWTLYAAYNKGYSIAKTIPLLSMFGVLLSALGAVFVYYKKHEPLRVEHAVKEKTHDLDERMRGLSTILHVNEVLKDERQSTDIAMSRVVKMLPPGWRHPEICAARIVIGEREYTTDDYKDTPFKIQAPMELHDDTPGYVEVGYTEERPTAEDEEGAEGETGPFLKIEQVLLNSLAEAIEEYYNKKLNRDKMVRSEASLRTTMEAIPVGVLLADVNCRILAINSAMKTIHMALTMKPLEVGDSFLIAIRPDREEEVKANFKRVMDDKEPMMYDVKYGTEEEPLYLNVSMIPVIVNAESVGVCITNINVTDRKKTEIEYRRIIGDLMQHMTSLVEFARVLNDKVREPLAEIPQQVDRAKGEKDEKQRGEVLDGILVNAQHVAGYVARLDESINEQTKGKQV